MYFFVNSGVFIVFIFDNFFSKSNTEKPLLNPRAQQCHVSDPQLSSLLVLSLGDFWNWKARFCLFFSKKHENKPSMSLLIYCCY